MWCHFTKARLRLVLREGVTQDPSSRAASPPQAAQLATPVPAASAVVATASSAVAAATHPHDTSKQLQSPHRSSASARHRPTLAEDGPAGGTDGGSPRAGESGSSSLAPRAIVDSGKDHATMQGSPSDFSTPMLFNCLRSQSNISRQIGRQLSIN